MHDNGPQSFRPIDLCSYIFIFTLSLHCLKCMFYTLKSNDFSFFFFFFFAFLCSFVVVVVFGLFFISFFVFIYCMSNIICLMLSNSIWKMLCLCLWKLKEKKNERAEEQERCKRKDNLSYLKRVQLKLITLYETYDIS